MVLHNLYFGFSYPDGWEEWYEENTVEEDEE